MIEQARINNLPINRRNYLDFALLAPGVVETTSLVDDSSYGPIQTPNSGLSFGGSKGRGNGFFIDGLENFSNAGGGVRPSISQEAAQEFQINRNSFSAGFGNALGGVINVISKSGTIGFEVDLHRTQDVPQSAHPRDTFRSVGLQLELQRRTAEAYGQSMAAPQARSPCFVMTSAFMYGRRASGTSTLPSFC